MRMWVERRLSGVGRAFFLGSGLGVQVHSIICLHFHGWNSFNKVFNFKKCP